MRIELKDPEWKRVINALKIKVPALIDKMAYNVIANTAAEARQSEMDTANDLELGAYQHTVRRRKSGKIDVIERTNLKRTNAGWVSTTRSSSKTGDYQMAHFSWERARTKYVKTADYTNQLANLWHRQTKPYSRQSPLVGRGSDPKKWMSWAQGESRPARYKWNTVAQIISSSARDGIVRTEMQFDKLLKKEIEG